MRGRSFRVGQVIHFEEQAVARLRERLGAAEEANEDLIAFARGHSGAVVSINAAVLAAMEAPSIDALLGVIVGDWPQILGIDFAAVALIVGDKGLSAGPDRSEAVEPPFVRRMLSTAPAVEVRSVKLGHPLFGRAVSRRIRAEAIIRLDGQASRPSGLLVLGQRADIAVSSSHGSELLLFLGQVVAATVRRFAATA